ncbi:DB112 protein, partial [Crocuta crocuta]
TPLSTTGCTQRFEKLYSEIYASSKIIKKAKYSTEENKTARSKECYPAFNPREACIKLSGQCKNQCGNKEIKMSYCAKPTTLCCLKECDPIY